MEVHQKYNLVSGVDTTIAVSSDPDGSLTISAITFSNNAATDTTIELNHLISGETKGVANYLFPVGYLLAANDSEPLNFKEGGLKLVQGQSLVAKAGNNSVSVIVWKL